MRADFDLSTVILARLLLDGNAALFESGDFPIADWLRSQAATAGLDDERAGQLAATILALELGWRLFHPFIEIATGIDPQRADDLFADSARTVLDALERQWRRHSS